MWFVERTANQIGRMTTAGVVTNEYPIPTVASGTLKITVGSDGALWFTENAQAKIGRVSTGGGFTEYSTAGFSGSQTCGSPPCLSTASQPHSIVAGPDGALWFTDVGPGAIGRITTSGAIAEFPVSQSTFLADIAVGPDRALWFADFGGQIGRITTSGAVTNLFPAPRNLGPISITAGTDGALWFGDGNTPSIGRVTTIGQFSDYPLPSGPYFPGAVIAGPDGGIWFTALVADVGRISPTVAVPVLSPWTLGALGLLLTASAWAMLHRGSTHAAS
jgi:streptogramin lyase